MKHINTVKKFGAGLVAAISAPAVMASPSTDWSSLTNAIDFGTLATGLLAAGAALVGVYLTIKGVKIIVGMVRS